MDQGASQNDFSQQMFNAMLIRHWHCQFDSLGFAKSLIFTAYSRIFRWEHCAVPFCEDVACSSVDKAPNPVLTYNPNKEQDTIEVSDIVITIIKILLSFWFVWSGWGHLVTWFISYFVLLSCFIASYLAAVLYSYIMLFFLHIWQQRVTPDSIRDFWNVLTLY